VSKRKPNAKMGRPTRYSEELVAFICEKIATHDVGLDRLCAMYEDMPVKDTINRWMWKYPEFSDRYMKAKQHQALLMGDTILEIADDGKNDYMESFGEDGVSEGWKINGEHVSRSKLRIHARQWLAAKLAPKIYGEKLTMEQNIRHEDGLKKLK
jgi:hypothetical protein